MPPKLHEEAVAVVEVAERSHAHGTRQAIERLIAVAPTGRLVNTHEFIDGV